MKRTLAWIAATAICVLATLPARAAQLAYVPMPAAPREPSVAIEPIAKQLGWTFERTDGGAILDDGSGPEAIRIGSRLVREDGTDVALFEQPALDRNGHIELAISDAATLFHLSVQRAGTHVALVMERYTDVDIREVPRPATPPPAPVPTAVPEAYSTPALVQGDAGTLAVSVEFDGSNRVYQTSLAGNAGVVHGAVSSYGGDAVTNPVGVVTVGKAVRNVAFGTINNPLAGSVISNGSLTGATAHLANGNTAYDVSSGRSIDGNIAAVARTQGNDTDTLAFVSGDGAFDQPILRHSVIDPERWGTLDYETLLGGHGAGAGIHARTSGKTFLDAVVSDASGSLPLTAGDLPTGAVIGEHLSSVTAVTAGYVRSIAAPGSPTVGVTTRWKALTLGANVSEYWTNFTASYAGPGAYGSFFTSAGAEHVFGVTGGLAFHRMLAEIDAGSSGGATSGIAQIRTNHPGLNFAGGFDLNAGTIRPLVGVVVPLAPSLAFEVGVVAGPSGRPALRLSMLAGFRQPKPRIAMFPVTVFVPDATRYGALRVFVDGVRTPAPYAAGTPIMVAPGRHTVYAESADRSYASTTCNVVATGTSAKVNLTMFPQRSIAGTIVFGGSVDALPPGASLEGIRVVLEPSGESVATDVNGRFVFARAPYDPASTILLDPASVPHGFESPGSLAIADGSTDVTLAPQRKTEHTTFH
jgi:hypothetical protein